MNMDPNIAAMQAQLQALQGQQQPQQQAAQIPGLQSAQMAPGGAAGTISIPVKLDTPMGKVRIYLNCAPGDVGQLQQLWMGHQQMLQQAHQMGIPLDAWVPKQKSNWNNNRGGVGGGGWNRGGGW